MPARSECLPHNYRPILAVVLVVLAACGEGEPASTRPTTASTIDATATTPVADRLEATEFKIPFSLMPPSEDWRLGDQVRDAVSEIRGATDQWLIFTTAVPEDVDGWVEDLTTEPNLVVTDAVETEIGGAPATTFEVRVSPDAPSGGVACGNEACVELFSYTASAEDQYGWHVVADRPNRIWVVDVEGEGVAIFAETSEAAFGAWTAEVEEALTTLEWQSGG